MASETVVYYNILQQVFVIRHLFLRCRGLSVFCLLHDDDDNDDDDDVIE